MKVEIESLDHWFDELESESDAQVIGVYGQGSYVWGLSDKYSDRDFIVIWQDQYPDKNEREELLVDLGGTSHDFKDIPSVDKSVDMFELDGNLLNVAHVKEKDFFCFYEQLKDLKSHYKEQLLRSERFCFSFHKGKLEKLIKNLKPYEREPFHEVLVSQGPK